MKELIKYILLFCVLFPGLMICAVACAPSTGTITKGDRDVAQVTVGVPKNGQGDSRHFYILRDPLTGADYLVVVDAGIIKMEPIPKGVEK